MHTTILVVGALASTLSLAQLDNFNINTAEESRVVSGVTNFITTLEESPAFQTDVAAILETVPASVLAEAYADPEALLEDLASEGDIPPWVSAIPTSVIGSLETLAAKPIQAAVEIEAYLQELADEPQVSSAWDALQTAIPTSVQEALASDPVAYLESLVTATTVPSWVSDIPAPVQSEIGDVINGGLSIVASAFEETAVPMGVGGLLPTAASGFLPQAGYTATGTGVSSVGGANGTVVTGTPAAGHPTFQGAAASLKTMGLGLVAFIAGAGLLVHA